MVYKKFVKFGCTPAVLIEQELRAFEAYNIPFVCSMCEGNESENNDINNMDFDVFSGNDIFLDIDVGKHIQTILDSPTIPGLSFAHVNVKGMSRDG